MKETKKKILLFLSSIGPGMFLVGYNIGTGSVTTMAQAGASYNMMLTWTILVASVFTYFLLIAFGRYTVVTGDSALYSYKKHFGKPVALFVLLTIIFTEMVSSIGVMAIVTDVLKEWSKPLTTSGDGINTIILTFILAGIIVFTLINGRYSVVEKILTVFVALMGISFIIDNVHGNPRSGSSNQRPYSEYTEGSKRSADSYRNAGHNHGRCSVRCPFNNR